jgi:hypothetical protein
MPNIRSIMFRAIACQRLKSSSALTGLNNIEVVSRGTFESIIKLTTTPLGPILQDDNMDYEMG